MSNAENPGQPRAVAAKPGDGAGTAGLFKRIIRDITILDASLASLRRSCQLMRHGYDMRVFRRLWDEAGDALSFMAVLAARADKLDHVRQVAILIRLGQLRETMLEEHLRAVEPMMEALAGGEIEMSLGTGYVMARWLNHLELTWADVEAERKRLLTLRPATVTDGDPEKDAIAAEEAAHERVVAALNRSAALARTIIAGAPTLHDFSQEAPPHGAPLLRAGQAAADDRPAAGLGLMSLLPAVNAAEGVDGDQADHYGVIFLARRDGDIFVDPETSNPGIKALRVSGLMDDVAKEMGIPRHRLTTILAGRDAVNFAQLSRLQGILEEVSKGRISARLLDR